MAALHSNGVMELKSITLTAFPNKTSLKYLVHVNQPTNYKQESMVQGLSWKYDRFSAGQEIPYFCET